MAEPGAHDLLGEGVLRFSHRSVRVTIESGDALATPADVLLLKHAQASYGLDRAVVERLASHHPQLVHRLPLPGRHLAVPAGSGLGSRAASLVLFVGTPPLNRFGYDAVRTWAREALDALAEVNGEASTVATTVHGVNIGGTPLDDDDSLAAQLDGFRDGLARSEPRLGLQWIRIVENHSARAERLATALNTVLDPELTTETTNEPRYSNSVRSAREAFGRETKVTASALARALQKSHPEYANGTLDRVSLDVNAGPRQIVDEWLERVRDLYAPEALAQAGKDVINGRLILAGLTTLDPALRRALDEAGVTGPLWAELDVKPSDAGTQENVAWTPDAPATVDRLGRQLVATALGERLEEYGAEYPGRSFLVHIDGPWGAGKSTLLKFLTDYARGADRQWCVVDFDAWRQARAGPPWRLLLGSLRMALTREGYLRRRTILRERWRLLGLPYQVASIVFAAVLGLLVGSWTAGVVDFDTASSATFGIVTLVGSVWAGAKVFGRLFVFDSRRSAMAFVDTRRDPMEELARHFQWLRRRSRAPLLLVIDDLDRCDDAYVVELLDNVQKLVREEPTSTSQELSTPPTLFIVVAADGRWLRRSYEVTHPSFTQVIGEPGRPLGSLFLDKLFQLRVPVPQLSSNRQESFLRSVLRADTHDDRSADEAQLREQIETAATGDDVIEAFAAAPIELRIRTADAARKRLKGEQEAEHALVRFAPLLEPNPRSILRFTMAFDILRAARLAEGSAVPTDQLALWTIVSVRWPVLAEFLQRDPSAVALFLDPVDKLRDRVPADLLDLFAEPSTEIRNVFNHPLGGPLTAAAISESAGIA